MLYGNRIALRAWAPADVAALGAMRNDIDLQLLLMAEPRPNSEERVRHWLQERSAQADSVFFVIAESETNHPLGFIQATRWDRRNQTAYLGIGLAAAARGKGVASQALRLMEDYLHDVLNLRKLLLEVIGTNARALELYRRAGYAVAGTLRAHHLIRGVHEDVVIMEKRLDSPQA